MKLPTLLLLALLVITHAGYGQQPTPPPGSTPAPIPLKDVRQAIFRCTTPAGTYEVAARAILAVAVHEYVLDGVTRVTELNVDTSGALATRFYFIEPNAPGAPAGIGAATLEKTKQLLTEATERTGQDVWKKVVKNYPATTHARTVEYRIASKEELRRIETAAREAFLEGKSVEVKLQ